MQNQLPHTSTASALLHASARTRFSTLSTSIDDLIAHFATVPRSEHATRYNLKGKERTLDVNVGAITPGLVFDLSGPPGSGKTCVSIGVALSARLGDGAEDGGDAAPEVLLIGE